MQALQTPLHAPELLLLLYVVPLYVRHVTQGAWPCTARSAPTRQDICHVEPTNQPTSCKAATKSRSMYAVRVPVERSA